VGGPDLDFETWATTYYSSASFSSSYWAEGP
jgi:hypothetical protein